MQAKHSLQAGPRRHRIMSGRGRLQRLCGAGQRRREAAQAASDAAAAAAAAAAEPKEAPLNMRAVLHPDGSFGVAVEVRAFLRLLARCFTGWRRP